MRSNCGSLFYLWAITYFFCNFLHLPNCWDRDTAQSDEHLTIAVTLWALHLLPLYLPDPARWVSLCLVYREKSLKLRGYRAFVLKWMTVRCRTVLEKTVSDQRRTADCCRCEGPLWALDTIYTLLQPWPESLHLKSMDTSCTRGHAYTRFSAQDLLKR